MQIIAFGAISVVVTGALWKPFKNLQKIGDDTTDTSSDMLGMVVELTSNASREEPGIVKWSGVDWKAVLDKSCPIDSIKQGEDVKITAITAGKMTITTTE
jgi:membrane protein implicated in regulation of membrane protease activity